MKVSSVLQHAYIVAQESHCVSWKVGAIITKDGRIISTGYNGTPAGGHENCDDHAKAAGWLDPETGKLKAMYRQAHNEWSSCNEIHAELNAILYAAKSGQSIDGAEMYVTVSPCRECAKAIAQSGIKKVFYNELYDRNTPGWDEILVKSGIKVIHNKVPLNLLKKEFTVSNQN
ncbi:cd dCMP deaminase [Aeromonas phage 31]|uniref:dCMP deaminase n=4 Tax=Biquartavirus TaxID=1912143 RepID=Q6U9A4_9CAUD|nr:dCMP deaminase [Aeromonas phage 44RR2.8t]YP_238925.1 dCMP deaminase [Aeromonas phage 31]APU00670.1 dCMP deaminase [Aeromonas phage 44RR2.8t.2]APU01089.1 dCMP deaminase [Aeromonas phage 31.2]APU01999.1 dCMP deaminase [Aeromonas phage L9-6]APU02251.1 dCMP deaminase [Aeromonas phage Riv-10]APU02498.1 dCMP deaminase [Aeromonas phage SW69-9]UYD59751.1 deoxycytidylate deaminase [Aeromonas phage avDM5]UYD60519.1 deoxycytidylate deaminase [Aeromonas phage avDM2]